MEISEFLLLLGKSRKERGIRFELQPERRTLIVPFLECSVSPCYIIQDTKERSVFQVIAEEYFQDTATPLIDRAAQTTGISYVEYRRIFSAAWEFSYHDRVLRGQLLEACGITEIPLESRKRCPWQCHKNPTSHQTKT